MKKNTRNKFLAMFMAVLMLAGAVICPQMFQSEETSTADAATVSVSLVLVTGDEVNIRSAASTSSSIIDTTKKGFIYKYLGESNGFYKIYYDSNTEAYISKSYTRLNTYSALHTFVATAANGATNIRYCPAAQNYWLSKYNIAGTLGSNSSITVYAITYNQYNGHYWALVNCQTRPCWIAADCLSYTATSYDRINLLDKDGTIFDFTYSVVSG